MSPSVFAKGLRHAVDQRRGRIVGHETLRQLARNEVRRRGMVRQNVEHLLAILHAAAGRNRHAEHHLLALVVQRAR